MGLEQGLDCPKTHLRFQVMENPLGLVGAWERLLGSATDPVCGTCGAVAGLGDSVPSLCLSGSDSFSSVVDQLLAPTPHRCPSREGRPCCAASLGPSRGGMWPLGPGATGLVSSSPDRTPGQRGGEAGWKPSPRNQTDDGRAPLWTHRAPRIVRELYLNQETVKTRKPEVKPCWPGQHFVL